MDPTYKTLGRDDLLCAKCGANLKHAPIECRTNRLCPRHFREAIANHPPFACTTEDIDIGYEGYGDERDNPPPRPDNVRPLRR